MSNVQFRSKSIEAKAGFPIEAFGNDKGGRSEKVEKWKSEEDEAFLYVPKRERGNKAGKNSPAIKAIFLNHEEHEKSERHEKRQKQK